jgi:light-harvesting protein B-800-850 alpha chain
MNNGRLWLVVKPTVGIPLFLGAVAVGSFAVHLAVLSHAGWFTDFTNGRELGTSAYLQQQETNTANVVYREGDKVAKITTW